MQISVIIPIYDQLHLTVQCIESIRRFSFYFHEMEVVIIDDGPGAEASAFFADFTGKNTWLKYHKNESNLKFAGSCNTGAQLARGDHLIFLNNDTVVTEHWDKYLLGTIENDPETWMVGARLLFPDGTIQHAGVYLPELTGNSFGHVYRCFPAYFPPANFEKELQCVTAACIMMRRAEFLELGGFDTGFLNGSEDIDMCLRIISLGKKIRYQPKCVVTHFESTSAGRFSYSKQNAGRLAEKWKGKARSDFRERVEEDIRQCISLGLMSGICKYGHEAGWSFFMQSNSHLRLNGQGNPELELPPETRPCKIPLDLKKAEGDLFIWLEVISSENSTARLQCGPAPIGADQPSRIQYLRPGLNHVMFSVSAEGLADQPGLMFTGKRSTLEFLRISILSYRK